MGRAQIRLCSDCKTVLWEFLQFTFSLVALTKCSLRIEKLYLKPRGLFVSVHEELIYSLFQSKWLQPSRILLTTGCSCMTIQTSFRRARGEDIKNIFNNNNPVQRFTCRSIISSRRHLNRHFNRTGQKNVNEGTQDDNVYNPDSSSVSDSGSDI